MERQSARARGRRQPLAWSTLFFNRIAMSWEPPPPPAFGRSPFPAFARLREGGPKGRMGCGPLLRPESDCATVIANLRRTMPAFRTPSGLRPPSPLRGEGGAPGAVRRRVTGGGRAPLPHLLGKVARSAGWGVVRCFGPSQIERPSLRTFIGPCLPSAPHPAFGHPRVFARGQALPRFAEKEAPRGRFVSALQETEAARD